MVIGLGAAGASSLYQLSKQTNISVAGIDRFHPPHNLGSSHGESRIIRQAYFETPLYVPLVQQALSIWEEISQQSEDTLFLKNGSLMLGNTNSKVIAGAITSAAKHSLPFEYLSSSALRKNFPALKVESHTVAVWEKEAGILFPEKCITALLKLCGKQNTPLFFGEKVLSIIQHKDYNIVATDKNTFHTRKIILSTGAWLNKLLPDYQLPLEVERRTVHWFGTRTNTSYFFPDKLPVYIWEYAPSRMLYGFPDIGNGIKIGSTLKGMITEPDELDREVKQEEIAIAAKLLSQYFNATPFHLKSEVCMYTNTPDEHFILDKYPGNRNIILASPCSGHGFKFASIVGKILSDMALDNQQDFDIEIFGIKRFESNSSL